MLRLYSTSAGLIVDRDGAFFPVPQALTLDALFSAADPEALLLAALLLGLGGGALGVAHGQRLALCHALGHRGRLRHGHGGLAHRHGQRFCVGEPLRQSLGGGHGHGSSGPLPAKTLAIIFAVAAGHMVATGQRVKMKLSTIRLPR